MLDDEFYAQVYARVPLRALRRGSMKRFVCRKNIVTIPDHMPLSPIERALLRSAFATVCRYYFHDVFVPDYTAICTPLYQTI